MSAIEGWLAANPYTPPSDLQLSSCGWVAGEDGRFATDAGPFVIATLQRAERTVPAQLVNAKVQERVDQMQQRGMRLGKTEMNQLRAEIKQELAFSIPPLSATVPVVFNPILNEVWLLAAGKGVTDAFVSSMIDLFDDCACKLDSIVTIGANGFIGGLMRNGFEGADLNFGAQYTVAGGDAGPRKQTFTHWENLSARDCESILSRYGEVVSIQIRLGEHMSLMLADDGTLRSITVDDDLLAEWYRDGDQEDHSAVPVVGVRLWSEALTKSITQLSELAGMLAPASSEA